MAVTNFKNKQDFKVAVRREIHEMESRSLLNIPDFQRSIEWPSHRRSKGNVFVDMLQV